MRPREAEDIHAEVHSFALLTGNTREASISTETLIGQCTCGGGECDLAVGILAADRDQRNPAFPPTVTSNLKVILVAHGMRLRLPYTFHSTLSWLGLGLDPPNKLQRWPLSIGGSLYRADMTLVPSWVAPVCIAANATFTHSLHISHHPLHPIKIHDNRYLNFVAFYVHNSY